MRLSDHEVKIIKQAIHSIDPESRIYLFGSRADDSKSGGDIDLLILSDKLSFQDKQTIRLRICEKLGEQKIDIIVAEDFSKPFVKIAYKEGIQL